MHGTDTTDEVGKRGNPDNVHRNWKKIRKSQKQRKLLSKSVTFTDNYIILSVINSINFATKKSSSFFQTKILLKLQIIEFLIVINSTNCAI